MGQLPTYLEFSQWVVTLSNLVIIYGLYDQAFKIWRTKSAKDFTWTLIVALIVNEAAWLNYGYALWEWPIILVSCLNFPAIIYAGIGYLKYGRKKDA